MSETTRVALHAVDVDDVTKKNQVPSIGILGSGCHGVHRGIERNLSGFRGAGTIVGGLGVEVQIADDDDASVTLY